MKRRLWDVPLWKQGRKVILAFGLALTMFASACGTSSSETTSEAGAVISCCGRDYSGRDYSGGSSGGDHDSSGFQRTGGKRKTAE